MNRHAFSAFLVVVLLFILSSITLSAQQPRAVPSNDDFIDAKTIKIGKSYTVLDIGAATNEGGEPGASCKYGATPIPNSVWFKFTLPMSSYVSLSTFGSLLVAPEYHNTDTLLAVYELTGVGIFTERACSSGANGSSVAQLVFDATGGKTYYVAAGPYGEATYLPQSTLKLSTRMIWTLFQPPNHGFEAPITTADWILKNGGDDQVVCSDATYPAISGLCTFRFTGTPGTTTKLTNTMAFPTTFRPEKNAFLSHLFYFRVMDTASLGKTKVRFIIHYSDGQPPSIYSITLTGLSATPTYSSRQYSQTLKSSKVKAVTYDVKFGSSTGTLLLDVATYFYTGDPARRGSDLLPVPPVGQ